jgi:hypothetical protein
LFFFGWSGRPFWSNCVYCCVRHRYGSVVKMQDAAAEIPGLGTLFEAG